MASLYERNCIRTANFAISRFGLMDLERGWRIFEQNLHYFGGECGFFFILTSGSSYSADSLVVAIIPARPSSAYFALPLSHIPTKG